MSDSETLETQEKPEITHEVPVDWEALEDAFENNAHEVHSYLHYATGEVLRVVDGLADPMMHARIAADGQYLRIEPVNSREQYRWMERFIPIVDNPELKQKLLEAIDGKGAFRRFKDALINYAEDREKWFTFRSERLRSFMEAWLAAHGIRSVPRPPWADAPASSSDLEPLSSHFSEPHSEAEPPKSSTGRRIRSPEASKQQIKDLIEQLGPRELDTLVLFSEFLKARRAARAFAHHYENQLNERDRRTPLSDESVALLDKAHNEG